MTAPDHATVLLVEDDPRARVFLSRLVADLDCRVLTATSAEEALDALNIVAPDLILADVHMAGTSGIELCARVKNDPRHQFTPVVILTALSQPDLRVAALAAGADGFFPRPFKVAELSVRIAALLRAKALSDRLDRPESVFTTLALALEARDAITGNHSDRLSRYAVAIGQALGADEPTLGALRLGGRLHDLGKIAVPDAILLKPGPLDALERQRIRTHPDVGADLIQALRSLEPVQPIIRHHHEKWNGSGYPDGLKGEEIPFGARIISVADVYDALRVTRPYRAALAHDQALSLLLEETDSGFWDPKIVTTFVDVLRDLEDAAAH